MSMSQMINEYTANALAEKLDLKYDNIIYHTRLVEYAWTVATLAIGVRLLQISTLNSWEMYVGIISLCCFVRAVAGPLSDKELTAESLQKLQQFFDEDDTPKDTNA